MACFPRISVAIALTLALALALATGASAATHKHFHRCAHRHCHMNAMHPKRSHRASNIATPILSVGTPEDIASSLAAPCQDIQLVPTPENLPAVREATLCLINQERARNDELPLQTSERLEGAAQSHSERMVGEDYFAHTSPAGETPLQRIQATGYIPNRKVGYTIGENIAWGTLGLATPQAIVASWMASPEHLANILRDNYRDTAIGIDPSVPASCSEDRPGATYTQEFGVIEG